jgi:PQQ-like domain
MAIERRTGSRLSVERMRPERTRDGSSVAPSGPDTEPAHSSVYDAASALGVSPDGTAVFVTGQSHGLSNPADYPTVAYDATTGAKLWVSRYEGPANRDDKAWTLGVSPGGTVVFVTGESFGLTNRYNGYDYAMVAYDASTGATLWVSRYNGPANDSDRAYALGVSPGGTVFVTGGSKGTAGYDYATVAYSVN